MEKLQFLVRGYEHLTAAEKHRARRADAIYEAAFDEVGIKRDPLQKFPAWMEFVSGLINEVELWEKVLAEREHPEVLFRKAV